MRGMRWGYGRRMATLHAQAFAAIGAIMLDQTGHRAAAIVIGGVAVIAGFVTTMVLLHEARDPPAAMMRGVLMAIASKAALIVYAVWMATFGGG